MGDYASLVAEEITATLDRAGFEGLSSESFRIEVTDSFQRKLGACRPARRPDESADTARYEIRIARRVPRGVRGVAPIREMRGCNSDLSR